MNRRIGAAGSLLVLAAIGCEVPQRHMKLELPREEVGEVRGYDETHGLFGKELHVSFQSVDGQDLEDTFDEGLPQVIDLLPGKHTLICQWLVIEMPEHDEKSGLEWVHLDVEAGRVYQAELYWEKHEERVRFHEIRREDAATR